MDFYLNTLKHFYPNRWELMLESSYIDCHAKGVHSVVFDKDPATGCLFRMYFVTGDHELYLNHKNQCLIPNQLSVGIHNHRQGLLLRAISGFVTNIVFEKVLQGAACNAKTTYLNDYVFDSKIKGGTGEFLKRTDAVPLVFKSEQEYSNGDYVFMGPSVLHTVYVQKHETAAWIIQEVPLYLKGLTHCFNKKQPSTTGMYKPMTPGFLVHLLGIFDIAPEYVEYEINRHRIHITDLTIG